MKCFLPLLIIFACFHAPSWAESEAGSPANVSNSIQVQSNTKTETETDVDS